MTAEQRLRQVEAAIAHLKAHIPTIERELAEIKRMCASKPEAQR
jgi:hypothetical protein